MKEQYWFDQPRETEKKGKVHESLVATVKSIQNEQTTLYSDYERYAAMYKDRHISSFDPGEWGRDRGEEIAPPSYNVVRACTNTMTSRITMHEPMLRVLTSDAPESDQERARKMEKFITGAMHGAEFYRKARHAFRDACIYGIGILKVYPGDGGVKVECVHPSRVIVDDNAALDGDPPSVYQLHYKSREELISLFPAFEKEIETQAGRRIGGNGLVRRDLLPVYEGWHLSMGDKKGRQVCCIEGATLQDVDYDDEDYQFVPVRWTDDLMGWHGIGLAEELEGIQQQINELIDKIKANMDLLAVPYILKPLGAEINDEHLATNRRARIVEFSGPIPPKVETPPAVHPQVIQWLEQLYQRAYEVAGISQMSASSEKPGSLRSGLALMTMQDVETQRFSTVSHNWNEFYVRAAHAILRAGKKVSNWKVQASSKDFIETMAWSDVNMPADRFTVHTYPQSALPRQPAGRRQFAVEMVQSQIITPVEAKQLLELGDVDKYQRLANAEMDNLERTFEHMLSDDGEFIPPVEFQDLELGLKLASQYYSRAHLEGKDEDRIALIVRWMQEASDLLAPPEPPMGMMGPAGPGGAPMGPVGVAPQGAEPVPVDPLAPAA